MDSIEGFPVLTLEYGKSGKPKDSAHAAKLKNFVRDQALDELLVVSHGWNNSASEARALYEGWLREVRAGLPSEPGLAARTLGVLAVIWPSKKFQAFEREDESQSGGAASAMPEIGDPLADAEVLLEELGDEVTAEQRETLRSAAAAAVRDESHWPAFLDALARIVPHDPDDTDDADAPLFEDMADPAQALAQFDGIGMGEDEFQGGGAASGIVSGAAGAVGSVLNLTTYYVMKRRAGKVGRDGLARTLADLRTARPGLRIHFLGHSFGARLVTMAAMTLGGRAAAAPDSLSLVQAAFSHNAFSPRFPPPNTAGFFRKVMSEGCVKGPIIVTHTHNDFPVRVAYSVASALAGDNAAFVGNTPGQFGGLGANGAQHMGAEAVQGNLLPDGATGYAFASGKVFNLLADSFIKGHSDVRGPQVGYAVVKAMAATL
jgi:hypothetical protein